MVISQLVASCVALSKKAYSIGIDIAEMASQILLPFCTIKPSYLMNSHGSFISSILKSLGAVKPENSEMYILFFFELQHKLNRILPTCSLNSVIWRWRLNKSFLSVSDSYAHKSGLLVGDYVITINGINTGNMSLQEINDKIKSVSIPV